MKKTLLTITAITLLIGCGGSRMGSTDTLANTPSNTLTNKEKITKLEDSGVLPKLNCDDTLKGVDSDNNGVRDDIDSYIEKKFKDPVVKKVAIQSARAMQMAVVVDLSDPDAIKKANDVGSDAVLCESSKPFSFQEKNLIKSIDSITTNTKKRLLHYMKFNHAMSGSIWSLPPEKTWSSYCE